MLYLDSTLEIAGITVFRDYNAPNRFYYMPGSPRLSREGGQPLFQLLIYREDIAERAEFNAGDRDGGGFLTMTVDLGVSRGRLDTVRQELSSRAGGPVDLVPVPFERGAVRVTALGESAGGAPGLGATGDDEEAAPRVSSGFVENILGSARPSMYGDNRAVFSFELSKRGALLMKASIEDGGASQIAVVYDLDYRGLMPARECSITIDFRQSYQHLRTRAQLNTLWFKSDIDVEMERLQKEGHIRIEDVDYLGLPPDKQAERATQLQNLAKELSTWAFFKPGLQPGRVLAQDRGDLQVYNPTSDATTLTAGFTTPHVVAANGRGDTGDTPGPRLPGRSALVALRRLNGSEPPRREGTTPPGDTTTPSSQPQRELTAVERWNQAGRPQAGFLLRSLSQEEQQTITFNLRQVSAVTRTAAPQSSIAFATGDASLAGRIKVVDLNDPFFDVLAGTVTTSADLAAAGVRAMVVKLRYGQREDGSRPKDAKEFRLEQTGDEGSYQFHLDHTLAVELEYQVVLHYAAGFAIGHDAPSATTPWIRTTTRNLDIDPRVVGDVFTVTLTAGQVDWNVVQQVQSTVEYVDAASGINASRTVVLTREAQTTAVHIRPRPDGSRAFKVASTYFYESTREGPVVQEGRDGTLVVLNQPPSKAVPVAVTLVDPLGRIQKATVETAYQGGTGVEQRALHELVGAGASVTWTFFRDALGDAPRYRYRVTVFANDGTTRQGEWQESAERQLIVGDVIEGLLEVQVRVMVPDLGAAGFMAMRLRLDYPDAPAWADRDKEVLFEGAPEPVTWRVPKKPGGGAAYTWRAQWFRADGSRVDVGPTTAEDEFLLVLPPDGA